MLLKIITSIILFSLTKQGQNCDVYKINQHEIQKEITLYKTYSNLHKITKKIINRFLREFKFNDKVLLDFPGLKSLTSYRRKKLSTDHDIDDIVRLTIVFQAKEDLFRFSKKLKNYFGIKKEENTLNRYIKARYRGYKLIVFHKFFPGYFLEIQLQTYNIYNYAKATHDLYKILRTVNYMRNNFYNLQVLCVTKNDYSFHSYFVYIRFDYHAHFEIFLSEIEYFFEQLKFAFESKTFLAGFRKQFYDIHYIYQILKQNFNDFNLEIFKHYIDEYLSKIYTHAMLLDDV
jgi:hypothetical protein